MKAAATNDKDTLSFRTKALSMAAIQVPTAPTHTQTLEGITLREKK